MGPDRLRAHSGDTDRYRSYIAQSRAEFTVARDQYVRPRTGWFSDRSACYLAAGRPVVTQETGFSRVLPTGDGLFAFTTMEDILSALDAIESDYDHHCRRARDIAAEYFSAERVLATLMACAGLLIPTTTPQCCRGRRPAVGGVAKWTSTPRVPWSIHLW